jgi:hypothetical protein
VYASGRRKSSVSFEFAATAEKLLPVLLAMAIPWANGRRFDCGGHGYYRNTCGSGRNDPNQFALAGIIAWRYRLAPDGEGAKNESVDGGIFAC